MTDKSRLFRNFNAARKLAKQGKLDIQRVNKALGLAQSKSLRPYHSDTYICDCPDAINREVTCKHQIAVALKEV